VVVVVVDLVMLVAVVQVVWLFQLLLKSQWVLYRSL
jgi:hypothetical protein